MKVMKLMQVVVAMMVMLWTAEGMAEDAAFSCPKQTTKEAFDKADYVVIARMRYNDIAGEKMDEPGIDPEYLSKDKISYTEIGLFITAVFKGDITPPKGMVAEIFREPLAHLSNQPLPKYNLMFARKGKIEQTLIVQTCDLMIPIGIEHLRLLEAYDLAKEKGSLRIYNPPRK